MALFGRRKPQDSSEPTQPEPLDSEDPALPEPPEGEPGVDRDWDRTVDGPFDVTERPEATGRLDLGTLRLRTGPGMQMRLDVEPSTNRLTGVTMVLDGSQMQLQVFAAPRSLGLWQELRDEIAEGMRSAGGTADEADGLLGPELRCRMPAKAKDGRVTYQPARFVGVDGPRWFLRAVVNGPAASDEQRWRRLAGVVRDAVVVRGDEPRPPRELLDLTAPPGVREAAAKQAGSVPADGEPS